MRKQISIVVVLALVTAGIVWLAETRNGFFDSKVYAGAIQYWFRDGGMVYDWTRPGTPYGFTYPPFAGLVMSPMAVLPFGAVMAFNTVATIAATAVVVWWLAGDWIRRMPRPVWFAFAVAVCLAVAFEPVRETITFGQVNVFLLALVAWDLLRADPRWAGVGIGLATAIKLTPGVFIVYLLLARRWRAAFTAMGTAVAATLVAAALFPVQSREFWTTALWDTDRVGNLWNLSNQSLRGFLARLPFDGAESYLWLAGVLALVALWVVRVRRADAYAALALTGVLSCLISPVTWIHHCVWFLPALIRCLAAGGRRRWFAAGAYVLLTSRLTWFWEKSPRPPLEIVGANLYFYTALVLLAWTPTSAVRPADTPGSAEARKQIA